eukprot:CAMPEP_0197683702 /NCGR_PEP_ID=MMETSP1338-20131121/98372_1 /TAXON_ID=43686 ORGANISM="Pelagodinium beii, Strain RCC1491" /NCGR_SAMPLE_ID=MMETSP1338 /ASSEMBLY_ACC=CAM_ASM_000754 /LENGTH=50 /DNA_ID=CAMNT_0043265327 /DNA_START=19 /DNA_END=168 /DNA_ORIENTATION=-
MSGPFGFFASGTCPLRVTSASISASCFEASICRSSSRAASVSISCIDESK